MKKVFVFALLLVFCAAASSFAWTGRMAGMGNPYGLVEDESDFLTHPTAITQGKGWQFYGDLGINWINTTKWDSTFTGFNILGGPMSSVNTKAFNGDGHEWMTDASFGFTFPVNTGRMGVFFNYSGNVFSRTKTDGTAYATFGNNPYPFYGDYSLKNDTDAYGFKVLYAQPFTDKVKFGGEFGIARRIEKRENDFNSNWTVTGAPYPIFSWSAQNDPAAFRFGNLFPFQMPYDSKYWETTMKASVEGNIGASNLKFTAFGGFIFSGENDYAYAMRSLEMGRWIPFNPGYDFTKSQSRQGSMEGSVSGWNIGGEAWWRFNVAKDIQLPFVVRAEYAKKSRTGDGYGSTPLTPDNYVAYIFRTMYDNNVKTFTFDIGGGVDYRISKSCGIAAGLYYTYTDEKTDFSFTEHAYGIQNGPTFTPWPSGAYPPNVNAYGGYPETKEHKLTLKFAGNFQVAPRVSLNTGLNFFYGWITTGDYDRTVGYTVLIPSSVILPVTSNYSLDGYQWGIGAAFGATIAFNGFSFEPYIKGGYRKLNISGDGTDSAILPTARILPLIGGSTDIHKTQWNIGGGFAVKF